MVAPIKVVMSSDQRCLVLPLFLVPFAQPWNTCRVSVLKNVCKIKAKALDISLIFLWVNPFSDALMNAFGVI